MTPLTCSHEGCEAVTTGVCAEGFKPADTCPHTKVETEGAIVREQVDEQGPVDLPTGEALIDDEAHDITRNARTTVVVIAGPSLSGKTTILTSLYESFLEAPFGNFLFAGSQTLVGFERRTHDARVDSGRLGPHTARTHVTNQIEFLHLRLSSGDRADAGLRDILFSDISGERFQALADSVDAIRDMPMLARADFLCIVLDGEKLSSLQTRYLVSSNARMLLRCLMEADALSDKCQIDVVISKWDLVVTAEDASAILEFVEQTKVALQGTASNSRKLTFHQIAARPENDRLPFAHGLPTLLRGWLDAPPAQTRKRLYLAGWEDGLGESFRFSKAVIEEQGLDEDYDVKWV